MATCTPSAVENGAYEYTIYETGLQEMTDENLYENPIDNNKPKEHNITDNASKEHAKSKPVIKYAILATVLVLLFGLAFCGLLLVLQEKVRVNEIKTEILEIRADMLNEQHNASWVEKNSAMEVQNSRKLNFLLTEAGWYTASNGFYYKIFEDNRNYTDARLQCQLKGARLVSTGLRDLSVRKELVGLVKAKGDHDVWIGANDLAYEGTYVWEDGVTSNGRDIDWGKYKPNNRDRKEHCLYYNKYDWKVNDIYCGKTFMYMCEKVIGN